MLRNGTASGTTAKEYQKVSVAIEQQLLSVLDHVSSERIEELTHPRFGGKKIKELLFRGFIPDAFDRDMRLEKGWRLVRNSRKGAVPSNCLSFEAIAPWGYEGQLSSRSMIAQIQHFVVGEETGQIQAHYLENNRDELPVDFPDGTQLCFLGTVYEKSAGGELVIPCLVKMRKRDWKLVFRAYCDSDRAFAVMRSHG